jgi:hypothetical protein
MYCEEIFEISINDMQITLLKQAKICIIQSIRNIYHADYAARFGITKHIQNAALRRAMPVSINIIIQRLINCITDLSLTRSSSNRMDSIE